jgi:hypothetical protein
MINLEETHQRLTSEIAEEREREMKEFVAENAEVHAREEQHLANGRKQATAAGIDVAKMESYYKTLTGQRDKELDAIKKKYAASSNEPKVIAPQDFRAMALDAALQPGVEGRFLPPAWAGIYSTKSRENELAGGTGTDVPNYTVVDAWDWASGAGWGWGGSGAGSYQVWVDWGYWFMPSVSKFYGITTHDRFRGYYIVRSFDDWWISAHSRVVVSMWTNVWQYNWKGWASNNVLDVGADNIDTNSRFDQDLQLYSTALLAGGDWAFVRSTIGLYVYARAGGSYSELNFANGSANYLAAPYVSIV